MIRINKYYPPGFDTTRYWEDKYAREHIAGARSAEFAQQDFWPLLREHLKRGARYLDAGCGIGGWILYLREQGYTVARECGQSQPWCG